MSEMISKPDANPILFAVLNWFVLGFAGYFMMGQQKKAIAAIVYVLLTSCIGLSPILVIIFSYDAFLLGQKLQSGESIGQTENGLGFLDSLPGFN